MSSGPVGPFSLGILRIQRLWGLRVSGQKVLDKLVPVDLRARRKTERCLGRLAKPDLGNRVAFGSRLVASLCPSLIRVSELCASPGLARFQKDSRFAADWRHAAGRANGGSVIRSVTWRVAAKSANRK